MNLILRRFAILALTTAATACATPVSKPEPSGAASDRPAGLLSGRWDRSDGQRFFVEDRGGRVVGRLELQADSPFEFYDIDLAWDGDVLVGLVDNDHCGVVAWLFLGERRRGAGKKQRKAKAGLDAHRGRPLGLFHLSDGAGTGSV